MVITTMKRDTLAIYQQCLWSEIHITTWGPQYLLFINKQRGANGIKWHKWHKMETFSMEKMEKPLSNSPFSPFYAMNFDHRMTYVAAYLGTLTCLFSHTRLLKAHTKLLEAHTRLLETHTRLLEAEINSTILQIKFHSISL